MTSFTALRSRFSQPTSPLAGFLSLAVGSLVLFGWAIDSTTLKSLVSGSVSMKPNTALAFILLGMALLGLSLRTTTPWIRWVAYGSAGAVTVIGMLTSIEYVLARNLGFDEWLFHESLTAADPWRPGRMGINTAICMALFGGALLMHVRTEGFPTALYEGLTIGGLFIAFMALLGYLYHDRSLYGIGQYAPMAIHTTLALLVAGIGILALHPDRGMVAVVTSDEAGGYMLRRLLPGALVAFPAIGWIRLYGERQGLYGTSAGLALFATLATVALFALLWRTARSLNEIDRRRGQTAAALNQSEQRRRLALFAVEHAGDGILWANMEQRLIYANEAACRSLGYSPEEIRGLTIADIVPHHDPVQYAQRLVQRKDGQAVHYESRHRRKDGTVFPVEVSLNYLEHAGHGFTCAIVRDITERKVAEEAIRQAREELEHRVEERTVALQESQRRLELILDATGVATWDWNVSTGAVQYNDQWAANRGMSIENVKPHVSSWSDSLHPDDRAHVLRMLQDCLDGTASTYEAEMRIRTAADEWTWVMDRGRVIERDAQGKAIRMAGIEIDVTGRKRAEQELKKAQAFVMSVLENIPNMIFIKDADDLRFVEINKAGEDLLGYRREEMIGKNDYDFFPQDEADFFTRKDREVLESGRLWDIPSEPIQTRQRGTRILHTKKIPLCDELGTPRYLLGISEDITERQMMEEALRASEERYSSLVSQATDVIYTAGMDGRFTYVNAAACAIMGYQEQELLGKHYLALIRPDFHEIAQQFYRQQLHDRMPSTYFEFPAVTKDGREIWFGQRVQVRFADGQPVGVEAITRDITERKRVEAALRESEDRLHRAIEASQAGTWRVDLRTGLDTRDAGLNQLLGLSCDTTTQPVEEWFQFIHPDDLAGMKAAWETAMATGVYEVEHRLIRRDGTICWVYDRGIVARDDSNQLLFATGAVIDITGRKQAEQALEERAQCAAFAADVSLLLNRDEPLDHQLQRCTDAAVEHLGAAFTRIWLRKPGDICEHCHKSSWCQDRTECLHLHASSGLSTNLNGEYRRVPLGTLKIGRIAQGMGPLFTNDVAQDERLPNKSWLRENGLQSFAGFPLIVDGQIFGVFATFGREVMSEAMRQSMESVCNGLAIAIARKQAETERQQAYDRLQAVTRQLAEVEEGERRRIAREIHDEFGQVLTGLKFDVAWLLKRLSHGNAAADRTAMKSKVESMATSVDGLIRSVRATAAALRPSVLDDLGLVAAIEWLATSFRDHTGLPCELMVDPDIRERDFRPDLATTVFRSAQELLTNVMRHARASTVAVRLSLQDNQLSLTVRDDGCGIQRQEWEKSRSLGLRGLHERVTLLGGRVSIAGVPNEGTTVSLLFPIESGRVPAAEERS